MHVRRKLIVGNWKMNGSLAALAELAAIAEAAREAAGADVAICPPFTLISAAVTRGGGLLIGAQDCHFEPSGAHTGCVSVPMLQEAGARLVIIGHSERRAEQGESDAIIRAKAEAALAAGLKAIVCVGETEAQRLAGDHVAVVAGQLAGSLPERLGDTELVLAYEPVWAIGTGNVATPIDVALMHNVIRKALVERFGDRGARVRILYGGSVKPDNAAELLRVEDVDGALVGGASLKAADFVPIVAAARG
ncbi:MAG TPA: triose-phosphate isomerase [Allosphingosinicella sp.]